MTAVATDGELVIVTRRGRRLANKVRPDHGHAENRSTSGAGSAATVLVHALTIGVCVCWLSGVAVAKPLSSIATPTKAAPPAEPDDGLRGGGFYLEADSLLRNDATHHVIAQGAVEARYKGRVVRAESLDYDTLTGLVIAKGHVEIVQPDGAVQFADQIQMDKSMSQGFALGFSTRLTGDVKIAASRTINHGAGLTEFDHVIYTPCEVCARKTGQPSWSIRARRVVENKKAKTLAFQGAIVEVKGIPVLYFPTLPAADPSADRKSGLLLPNVTISGIRGFSWEQPYYQVISPSQDLTLTPQINGRVNPFFNAEYRLRTYSGLTDLRVGYTYDQDFTSGGDKFGADTSRSYILGSGQYQLNPAWSWGFTAERASDPLIFDKYSVQDVFVNRGLYAVDDRRLISQIDAVRQDANSYLSIAAIAVQGLRTTDIQSTIPLIAPLIEARWEDPAAILGGRLRVTGSVVVLAQNQSVATIGAAGQPRLPGIDDRRATADANWQTTITLSNGVRIQPFLDVRGDIYNVTSVPITTSDAGAVTALNSRNSGVTLPRGYGMTGATITYPFIKQQGDVSYILEPIALISIANLQQHDRRIPNQDSTDFELDPTNIFQPNSSPGYDIYDGGQSITVGGRASVILDDGRTGSVMFGQRFAAESDHVLRRYTGLKSAQSDYVFGADTTLIGGLRMFANLRLSDSNFAVDRLESGVSFAAPRIDGYIAYLQEPQTPLGPALTSVDVRGEAFFTKHWGVSTYAIVDSGRWRESDFGLVYRDDCIRVEVLYRHDQTFNGTLGPTTSVLLRLSLATLGTTR
jgi:LPS-assembly protein